MSIYNKIHSQIIFVNDYIDNQEYTPISNNNNNNLNEDSNIINGDMNLYDKNKIDKLQLSNMHSIIIHNHIKAGMINYL